MKFFENFSITSNYINHDDEIKLYYNPNDFLLCFCYFWFVYSFTYLDKIFLYNSNSSFRIIKLLGNDINVSFFIKCLF